MKVLLLILFNVKLFTRYYSVTSKDMQYQEKCRFFTNRFHKFFMLNVIMVAETFTISVTQLININGPCSHMQIYMNKQDTIYIYIFYVN
jgi:hypothetical protein